MFSKFFGGVGDSSKIEIWLPICTVNCLLIHILYEYILFMYLFLLLFFFLLFQSCKSEKIKDEMPHVLISKRSIYAPGLFIVFRQQWRIVVIKDIWRHLLAFYFLYNGDYVIWPFPCKKKKKVHIYVPDTTSINYSLKILTRWKKMVKRKWSHPSRERFSTLRLERNESPSTVSQQSTEMTKGFSLPGGPLLCSPPQEVLVSLSTSLPPFLPLFPFQ